MGYPTKVQLINRKQNEQWYINFPTALARAMKFVKGEVVEWSIEDLQHLYLKRLDPPRSKKKLPKRHHS